MTDFKKMIGKIEDSLAAVSFAEEGEFESARQMLGDNRRVVLAVRNSNVDKKTLTYVMNTCSRIKAGLDILYVPSAGPVETALEGFLAELTRNRIAYRMVQKAGCLKQAIIEYANTRKEVLFAVIESSDNIDADCAGKNRDLSVSWKKMKCPLVVVSEAAKA